MTCGWGNVPWARIHVVAESTVDQTEGTPAATVERANVLFTKCERTSKQVRSGGEGGEAGATRASDQDSTYKATGSYETSGRTPLVVPPREAENPELGRPSGRPAHRGSPQPRAVDTPAFPRSWLDVSLEEHGPAPSRLRPAGHATVTRIWREICRARLARGVPGPASRALTCVRG